MLLVGPTNTQRHEGSGMDTSSGGPSRQRATHAGEPRRRRRWLFVVGGLVALGLVGLVVFAVVLILVATSGPTVPTLYDEEYVSGDGPDKVVVVPIEGVIAPADDTLGRVLPTSTPEGRAHGRTAPGRLRSERRRRGARDRLPRRRGYGKRRDASERPGLRGEYGRTRRGFHARRYGLWRLLHLDRGRPHSRQQDDPDGLIGRHIRDHQLCRGRGQVRHQAGGHKERQVQGHRKRLPRDDAGGA